MIFDKDKISEQLEANKDLLLEKFPAFSHYVEKKSHQYLFCPYSIESFNAEIQLLWEVGNKPKGMAIYNYSLKYDRERGGYWELLKEALLSQLEMESKAEINPDVVYPDTGIPLRKGFADDLTGMLKGIIDL
jgi:hypothetical protein